MTIRSVQDLFGQKLGCSSLTCLSMTSFNLAIIILLNIFTGTDDIIPPKFHIPAGPLPVTASLGILLSSAKISLVSEILLNNVCSNSAEAFIFYDFIQLHVSNIVICLYQFKYLFFVVLALL